MNQLVIQQNGNPVTTSRLVAETFKKRHKDVLKRINNLGCSETFTKRNFAPSEYTDSTGRALPEYIITKDGFTILAMGFTTKGAMKFKEEYIEEFNRKTEALKEAQVMLSQYSSEMKAELSGIKQQLTAIEAASLQNPTYNAATLPKIEGYATVKQYTEETDFPITSGENTKIRNACILICRKNNMEVKTWEDESTGYKHTFFPKSALHKAVSTVFSF